MNTAKKILMILPVPLPSEALEGFRTQLPPEMLGVETVVDFVAVKAGANILDSYFEMTLADAFVLEAGMRAEAEGYDAVCINSMSDSGLPALRSRLTIPVVGPGQACMLTACMLGNRFSVLTMWDRWRPLYRKVVSEQGLEHRLASVRSIDVRPDAQELLNGKEHVVFDALLREARNAIEEDGADTLILGSTTMHQSYEFLKSNLNVPVINPGVVALKLCEVLLDLGLSHSKTAWAAPENNKDGIFDRVDPLFP
tara:strand:+ start:475 stop:1236 length:762 start_codon:yes stop_codon:yes gene_type:complete